MAHRKPVFLAYPKDPPALSIGQDGLLGLVKKLDKVLQHSGTRRTFCSCGQPSDNGLTPKRGKLSYPRPSPPAVKRPLEFTAMRGGNGIKPCLPGLEVHYGVGKCVGKPLAGYFTKMASLRSEDYSPSDRNAVRVPFGISVRLQRNPQCGAESEAGWLRVASLLLPSEY